MQQINDFKVHLTIADAIVSVGPHFLSFYNKQIVNFEAGSERVRTIRKRNKSEWPACPVSPAC